MANITWMNTPIPDIGGTRQQGIRNAADLFNNATKSASAGVAGVQGIQEAEKAAQVAAADRFALENMLSTQDPNKYSQMRADGSLLGPAASQVSNATLLAAEQRGNQLYTQDRERTRNVELAAAEKIWDQASSIAVNNPAKAQEILAGAKFTNAEDAAAFSQRARQLYVDPESGRAAADRAKKEELERAKADLVDRVIGVGNNPDKANAVLMAEKDPLIRQGALDMLSRRGEQVGSYYSSAPVPTESPGVTADGVEGALYRRFGKNTALGRAKAGAQNPDPGSPEWMAQNGGRTPSQADIYNWDRTYVLPASEKERGEGKGTTAIGPYQIVSKTREDVINRYGEQLFGTTDMSKIPYTLENEEKIAGVIYREQLIKNKSPDAWAATQKYAGLRDLSAFEGKSFEEAKPLLAYIEGGAAPASFQTQVKQLESRLQERELGLSEGAKVILNAREKKDYGLNEAAADVAKALGKDTQPGDVRAVLERTVRQAKDAGTVITHAEAAGLILNAIKDDTWRSISDLTEDLDLEEGKLERNAKDLGNARADLASHEKNVAAFNRVKELSEQYKKDKDAAISQLTAAQRSSGAGEAALAKFRKWQDTSDQLRRLVAPTSTAGVNRGLVDDARSAPPPVANRAPDIDLMLPPQQSSPIQGIQDLSNLPRVR